jgi:hypothetical protein
MRSLRSRLVVALMTLSLGLLTTGCTAGGGLALFQSRDLRTSEIGGTMGRVLDRHDAWVKRDASLAPDAQQTALNDSVYLRGTLLNPTVTVKALEEPLTRVCDRHDFYLPNESTWTALQVRVSLRDTALLRRMLQGTNKPATGTSPPQ